MEQQGEGGYPVKEVREIRVIWESEERTLTLEGEPVLEFSLSWPCVEGGGLGGRWIGRYYAWLARGGAPPGGRLLSGRGLGAESQKDPSPPRLVPHGGGGGGLFAPVRRLPGGGGLPGVHPAAGKGVENRAGSFPRPVVLLS